MQFENEQEKKVCFLESTKMVPHVNDHDSYANKQF